MTQLILQTLLNAAGGIVAAAVGWLITRQLRIIFASTERTEQHVQDAASSAGAAADASANAERAVEELTAALKVATAALETVRENNDQLFRALLRQESQEIRLKRIEQYMADHEAAQFRNQLNEGARP